MILKLNQMDTLQFIFNKIPIIGHLEWAQLL